MLRFSSQGGRTALGGILAACSLLMLWLACLSPSGRMGLAAVAGLFPMAGVLAAGPAVGYLCWGAAGVLGLVLLPEKSVPLLYLIFLGVYPVVKNQIEAIRRQPLEWCLKLFFFNLALTLFVFLLQGLFLPNPPEWMQHNVLLLYPTGNAVFVCYDIGLSKMIALLRAHMGSGRWH